MVDLKFVIKVVVMCVSSLFSDGKAHSKTTTSNVTRNVSETAVNIAM